MIEMNAIVYRLSTARQLYSWSQRTESSRPPDGKSSSSGPFQKLVLLHESILVAQIELAEIRPNPKAIREASRSGRDVTCLNGLWTSSPTDFQTHGCPVNSYKNDCTN